MKLLAITACPAGIAHTYIAAEKLKKAATGKNIEIKVETRGPIGVENKLTAEEIETADDIIIAADKDVEPERFRGKPVYFSSVQDAIHKTDEILKRFINGDVPIYKNKATREETSKAETGKPKKTAAIENDSKVKKYLYRDLMNGVSYMIPFVVTGGLLIALLIGLGGVPTPKGFVIPDDSIWKTVNDVGSTGFILMVPILAGFISMSIAEHPGLAPGMIGGFIAANGSFYNSEAGARFIGELLPVLWPVISPKPSNNCRFPKSSSRLCRFWLFPLSQPCWLP